MLGGSTCTPKNVIVTPDGPQIIDWEDAVRGPAIAGRGDDLGNQRVR